MSHYNGTSSTPHSLFSCSVSCGFSHVNPRLHLEGRSARGGGPGGGGGGRRGAGGGGRSTPLPARAQGRADASITPRARKEGGGEGGSGRRRGLGEPRQPSSAPAHPPGPSALGLFHWRTMPKMVICVRGRECGFPGFRVTWRERDSLAGSCARLRPPSAVPWEGARPLGVAAGASAQSFRE